ncbi:MAG: class I SAM-dependent methyltransferase [Planctomycetota bacterium]|nr:MAG: class I SAM-dependent methyltransferase [Planctomycetota bacterium]
MKKLNLGSGSFPKKGFVNLDINPNLPVDIVHDLNEFPYPFGDNEWDYIECDHVLEHLEDPFRVMKELHRILKPEGILIIRVPHFSRGFTHPEHKRGFDFTFPYYFQPTFRGGYTGCEFYLKKMRFHWFGQPYLKKTVLSCPSFYLGKIGGIILDCLANLSPMLCSRLWCFWVGGFEEIEFCFQKPGSLPPSEEQAKES